MLPNDEMMLISFINTKLRDDDMSLETIIEVNSGNIDEVQLKLSNAGYYYDAEHNQLKKQ